MGTDSFLLRVITPSGLQVEEQSRWANLPSSEGQIGVLPGHVNYTTALGTGILEYAPILKEIQHSIVVSGGFVSFAEGILNVLADTVDTKDNIDAASLQSRRDAAATALASMNGFEPEWDHAIQELARLEACQKLIEK